MQVTQSPACSRHRRGRLRATLAGGATLAALAAAALVMPSAQAEPDPTLDQVQKTITTLEHQAEQASERYNETRENLKSVTVRLKAAKARLARQRVEVRVAKSQLGALAVETYKRGDLSTLDLMLSDDPQAVLAQTGYLPSLTDRQAGATLRLKQGERQLALAAADVAAQQGKAAAADRQMRAQKRTVERKLAAAEAVMNRLKASQRRALQSRFDKVEAVPAGTRCADYVAAASGRAKNAIAFACNQLGEPYRWAAAGPDAWDCSGFTMGSWRAAGVSLPHSSRMQAGYGDKVSVSNIQIGDLIFFNSPISHVAIYLGNGLMIHAPHTGDVVRIAPVYQTPSAATRLW